LGTVMVEKLQIDMDYLLFAWQDDSPDTAYYLDSDTGSVLLVQRDLDDLDELRDEIETQPARYLYVPKPNHDQPELDLSDFIYTVADKHLQDLLSVAYEGINKLGGCKTILTGHAEELKRWEKWRQDAARERVRRWLAANNLEAET
jgi:Uncharacterised protein family (UPF0158)